MTHARSRWHGAWPKGAADIMQRIVDNVLDLVLTAEGGALALQVGDGLEFAFCSGGYVSQVGSPLSATASLAGLSMAQVATLHTDDAMADPRMDRNMIRAVAMRSVVCVPLRYRAQVLGVLVVGSSLPHAFAGEDVSTLNGVAEFIASAVEAAIAMSRMALLPSDEPPSFRSSRSAKVHEYVAHVADPALAPNIERENKVKKVLAERDFSVVFQPVVDLRSQRLSGLEALARFHPGPYRPPNAWIDDAYKIGLGEELELALVEAALQASQSADPALLFGVNVSPTVVLDQRFCEFVERLGMGRVVVELTEHEAVAGPDELLDALRRIRRCGARLALDDVGSGFSSLARIVQLAPEIIKLDLELVRGIDVDPIRRSLASALVTFANESGARVVAEGVEHEAELEVLRDIGVPFAQGYLIGRPGPLSVHLGHFDPLAEVIDR